MHKTIKMIVFAKTGKEALAKAKKTFKSLVPRPFDYGSFFDGDDKGKGNPPAVVRADSREGKLLIFEGITATKRDFEDCLSRIKEVIENYSLEEIWHEKILDKNKKMLNVIEEKNVENELYNLTMFRHYCYKLGDYYDGWLYDNDGELINDEEHLHNVLNKWECLYKEKKEKENPYKDLEVWVIPVDIHQ